MDNEAGIAPDYRIDIGPWGKIKWQAIEQHRTQNLSIKKFAAMDQKMKETFWGQEYFNADSELSACPGKGTDLFGGLKIDGLAG